MSYLEGMNEAQCQEAVTHDPSIPLQILAGPGSGKTKVLTSRIAHLIEHYGVPSDAIVAVTFTNKAANEMKERLKKLVGRGKTMTLQMGTFHALCSKYLRVYGKRISLPENFSICDADESKKILKKILKLPKYEEIVANRKLRVDLRMISGLISRAKAKGQGPEDMSRLIEAGESVDKDLDRLVVEVFKDYSEELRVINSLDFDDLLIYGVKLFLKAPDIARKVHHVLVDEFQDTNVIQYQLMTLLASVNKGISIVGDPDQSIYGWRSADIENLGKMQALFHNTRQIFLEQNYRSTGSILSASVVIISGDKTRIEKTLFTSEESGPKPTLWEVLNDVVEAECIAYEIKRLVAHGGGLLGYNDFAVLLRYNALSRTLEKVFQKEGIPVRILGGHRFFDRLEVKDLISYLQLVDNPHNWLAFERAVSAPKRGVGEKSMLEVGNRAASLGISPMHLCQRIVSGNAADIKPAVKRKIAPFVEVVDTLHRLAMCENYSAEELLLRLVAMIDYEEWLKTSQPADWETRWENVKELIRFAAEAASDESTQGLQSISAPNDSAMANSEMENVNSSVSRGPPEDLIPISSSVAPLRKFLEATSLLSDPDEGGDRVKGNDKSDVPKVTISTCHSAKGLEWPVVFVPAAENRIFPFLRAEDIEEERRLLYVGCTRAQAFLYVSHCRERTNKMDDRPCEPSPFLLLNRSKNITNTAFSPRAPSLSAEEMALMSKILRRPPVDSGVSEALIKEFYRKNPYNPFQKQGDGTTPMNHPVRQFSSGLHSPHPQALAMDPGITITTGSFMQLATGAHTVVRPANPISTVTVDIGTRTTGTPPQAPDPGINSCPSPSPLSTDGKIVASIERSRHPPQLLSESQAQSSPLISIKQPPPDKPHHASIDLSGPTICAATLGPLGIAMDVNSQPTPSALRITHSTGASSISSPHANSVPGPTSNTVPRGRRLGMGARGLRPYEPPEKRARTKA